MDGNTFIEKFNDNLIRLPKNQREKVVREIEQHISHAISAGENESVIVARLGDPKVLAKTYIGDYYNQQNKSLKAIPFFLLTGFTSIFVVPVLGSFIIAFGLSSIMLIVASIMRTFGATWIHMSYWAGKELPLIWSIPFAVPFSIIFAIMTILSWKGLRKYFRFVSSSYQRSIQS